jgi:predicted amidohydrolase YtcJ
MSADLVVTNARITTLNPAQPQASALAVKDGQLVAVGDAAVVVALAGATRGGSMRAASASSPASSTATPT